MDASLQYSMFDSFGSLGVATERSYEKKAFNGINRFPNLIINDYVNIVNLKMIINYYNNIV